MSRLSDETVTGFVMPENAEKKVRYTIVHKLGCGSFGAVYRCMDTSVDPPRPVAIKIHDSGTYDSSEGTPREVLLEVAAHRALPPHANVATLLDVSTASGGRAALVFELMDSDLASLARGGSGAFSSQSPISDDLLRSYAYQLLRGLAHCHRNGVIHRDIKPTNLLINKRGLLKIADFGCARVLFGAQRFNRRPLTPKVVTLWYRAPELLQGATQYDGAAIDVWAAGCCIAEMFLGRALLPGGNELDQLMRICRMFGAPPPLTSASYAGNAEEAATAAAFMDRWIGEWRKSDSAPLPPFDVGAPQQRGARSAPQATQGRAAPPLLNELLRGMLDVDAARRATAEQCLRHAYFDPIRDAYETSIAAMVASQ